MKIKILRNITALLILLSAGLSAAAEQVYHNYTYDYWGNPVESPESYSPQKAYFSTDMGTTNMKLPQDMFVDSNTGKIYICDTGNNRIIVLDQNFKMIKEISEFKIDKDFLNLAPNQRSNSGIVSPKLASPTGIFVDKQGLLYIADSENKRVVVSTVNGNVVRLLTKPGSDVNFTGIDFIPMKIVVDESGYVYLLCKGVYHGAVIYTPKGSFSGYFGANRTEVTLSLLTDYFWRGLYTAEQRAKMTKYVPIEFSNLDVDDDGFIYTTTLITTTYSNHIKKFNHNSTNVLAGNQVINNSLVGFYGDPKRVWYNSEMYESRFTDICYRNGFINALDMARGRVFQYDDNGTLVCVFGGKGNQIGTFSTPSAIDSLGENILVLDSEKCCVTVFSPTDYGKKVHSALQAYNNGRYQESCRQWEEIADANNNCQLAYIGIAKALYENEDYVNAMKYFRLGQDRKGYGKAFKLYRNDILQKIIPVIVVVLVPIIVVLMLVKYVLRTKVGQKVIETGRNSYFKRLSWVWYTMRHPTKGFTDCKENRRYSVAFGFLIGLTVFAAMIMQRQFTGFTFNYNDPNKINILLLFVQSVLLLIVWSLGNWAVSTLLDGKGRVKEIFYISAVALVPYVLSILFSVVLSNIMVADEGVFITWLTMLGILWSVLLLFTGLMVIHDYSFMKMLGSVLLTLFLLTVVAFVSALLFSLFQQTFHFIQDIINEITFRNLKS